MIVNFEKSREDGTDIVAVAALLPFAVTFLSASFAAFLKIFASGVELGFDFKFARSRAKDCTGSVEVDVAGGTAAPTFACLVTL